LLANTITLNLLAECVTKILILHIGSPLIIYKA